MKHLAQQLAIAGPAQVDVFDREVGGHSIVVDSVKMHRDEAQLRDPMHGWAVTVPLAALNGRMQFPTTIVQAKAR
jgi:hypothetical protein